MQRDGSFPEVIAAFDQMTAHAPQIAQNIKGSPLGQLYPEVNWELFSARSQRWNPTTSTGRSR